MQLVGTAQQGGLEGIPAVVGGRPDPFHLGQREAGVRTHEHVVAPLVVGPAAPACPQDDQLPVACRKLASMELGRERHPPSQEAWMPREGGEKVRRVHSRRRGESQELAVLLFLVLSGKGSETMGGQRP